MKLIAIKPIYFEGNVLTEGAEFETLDQHGRELVKRGYAEEPGQKKADSEKRPRSERKGQGQIRGANADQRAG
ncbi:hypothetical protein ACOHPB_003960 [Cronobacter sakazakii]